jgi:DNA-binding protein HU-beta
MKKSELVRIISNKTGVTQKRVSEVVDALFDTLTDVMVSGDRYSHEGCFSVSIRKAKDKVCRNPLTSEKINVPAHYVPKFTPSKILKEKIKNANKDK